MTETEAKPIRTGVFGHVSTYQRWGQRIAEPRRRELHDHDVAVKFGFEVLRRIADGRRYIVQIETRENHVDDLRGAVDALNAGLAPPLLPTPESMGFDVIRSRATVLLADPFDAEVGEHVAHAAFLALGLARDPAASEVHLEPRHRLRDGSYLPSTTMALLRFQRESDDVWTRLA